MAEVNIDKNKSMEVVICSTCSGLGNVIHHHSEAKSETCLDCGGAGVWLIKGNEKYFWEPKNKPAAILFQWLMFAMAAVIKILAILFIVFSFYKAADLLESSQSIFELFTQRGAVPFVVWSAIFIIIYWVYSRRISAKKEREKDYDIFKIVSGKFTKAETKHGKGFNIEALTDVSAKKKIFEALAIAKESKSQVNIWHLLKALFVDKDIERVLVRLEVNREEIIKLVNNEISKNSKPVSEAGKIEFDADIKKAMICALREAVKMGKKNIDKTCLFISVAVNFKDVNFFLQESGISAENLHTGVMWSQREKRGSFFQRLFAGTKARKVKIKHNVMNRAWTARPTPIFG